MGCEATARWPPLLNVIFRAYIDGFNLYNGAIRRTGHKWLDLAALCQALRPNDQLERVVYCTAQVESRPDNPHAPLRQRVYWRALRAHGKVDIVEGKFRRREKSAPTKASLDQIELARLNGQSTIGMRPTFVEIVQMEEKGTDINLAVQLLNDAHLGRFEGALVITNDSDIAPAIQIVTYELGLPVWGCNPRPKQSCVELKNASQK